MTPTIIAIAGPSASGKTLLANTIYHELKQELAPSKQTSLQDVTIIAEDAYYRDQSHLSMAEREQTNYDHPDAFEHELLRSHLQQLLEQTAVQVPSYDFSQHTRRAETQLVQPAKVILLEGILLLSDPQLRELFNIKVFVDTPLDICLLRRIERDMQERGRDFDSIVAQYNATVRPMYFEHVAASRSWADIVVMRGGRNRIAIDLLKRKITGLLRDK